MIYVTPYDKMHRGYGKFGKPLKGRDINPLNM